MKTLTRWLWLFCLTWQIRCQTTKLEEVFNWKIMDFDFPTKEAREKALKSKSFIPENNQPLGLAVWKNKLFVSFPPWKPGVVATLTYIDLNKTKEKSPKLKPYPDWKTHDLRNTTKGNKLANVIRPAVDRCDRLWVADRGMIDIMGTRNQLYNPKVQIYDLKTDKLIRVYSMSRDIINEYSFFGNVVVDVTKKDCSKAHLYISDLRANSIFVYSYGLNEIWRVEHHFFHFDPLSGDYIVGDIEFQWTDGIISMSLSEVQADSFRTLYFCPMSSTKLFAVSTEILQNRMVDWTAWNNTEIFREFRVVGDRGPLTQYPTSVFDEESGVLFYTLLCQDAIACWNTRLEYGPATQAILARNKETLSYTNDLKIDENGVLWAISDRLHEFVFAGQNFADVNFRIFRIPVREAIAGTVCEKTERTFLQNF